MAEKVKISLQKSEEDEAVGFTELIDRCPQTWRIELQNWVEYEYD